MRSKRLDENCISDLLDLIDVDQYPLDENIAGMICSGRYPTEPCTQVYGIYNGKELVSIMTATYCIVFPHKDGTRVVQISGAYTREDMRSRGYAGKLLQAIEHDAAQYFHADYLCCDSTADALYEKNGFIKAPGNESRLWKCLNNIGQA